jgi:hypothetical protein
MASASFASYEEFWPYYLAQHLDPRCRALHVGGTAAALLMIGASPAFPPLALAAPVVGYGCSWIGHFVFEKNRPAAFRNPWWSLRGDLRMLGLTLAGRIGPELERARAAWA